jgi:hypothetical protein
VTVDPTALAGGRRLGDALYGRLSGEKLAAAGTVWLDLGGE